jgi:hypothetical protein
MAVKTSGFRAAWFDAVTVLLMDGGDTPPSVERLTMLASRRVGSTARNDGYVTSRNNGGDADDYEAGWAIIVGELVALLREHGYINGDLRWVGPTSGKVSWGGTKHTVRPADERQATRDHRMVMLGSHADYGQVQVVGARGGVTTRRLEVHPLAHLLPQIPVGELAKLRVDIEQHGVLVPLLMFEDKVLDGRHRLYLAAKLDKPVRLEEFEGTEQEARARVGSLNLWRRHLNGKQKGQLAIDLYLDDAKKEAAEARAEGNSEGGSGGKSTPVPGLTCRGKTAAKIVADKAGPGVSRSMVEALLPIQDAPETVEKIRAGDIKTLTDAVDAAHKEMTEAGKNPPPKVDPWPKSANADLGRMLTSLRKILAPEGVEPAPVERTLSITDRLDEIEAGVRRIREALQRGGVL